MSSTMRWMGRIQWFNAAVLTITPSLAVYGAFTTPVHSRTLMLCLLYYLFGMIGKRCPWEYPCIKAHCFAGITAGRT
jgi:hypothetical protein